MDHRLPETHRLAERYRYFSGPFDQLSEAIPQRLGRVKWKESQLAALELGLQLYSMEVRSANDFESAFKEDEAASAAPLL